MGYFRNVMAAIAGRGPADDFWYRGVGELSASGISVSPDSALQLPIVVDCLNVITKPIASLPLIIYRKGANGLRERADDHPLFKLLHDQPNDKQTAYEFRGEMQWNLALYNNAYAEIKIDQGDGRVTQLLPIHPGRVTVRRNPSGAIVYDVREPQTGQTRRLVDTEMWHLRGLPLSNDGLTGIPQISLGRTALGAAIALQDFAARFFANDARAGGIIEHPTSFKDDESRRTFLNAWRAAGTGANAHKDRVLEFGLKYDRETVTNESAQMLQTRKELDLAIARLWNIPPHKIGILDKATFSNIEQQSLEFIMDTMLPIFELWEQAIRRDLIVDLEKDTIFAEFNVTGLLRGDLKARFESYAKARQWGWMSVNDIRHLENLNPVPGGDEYLRPMNMTPVGGSSDVVAPNQAQGRPAALSAYRETTARKANGHDRTAA